MCGGWGGGGGGKVSCLRIGLYYSSNIFSIPWQPSSTAGSITATELLNRLAIATTDEVYYTFILF